MESTKKQFQPDKSQEAVINFQKGYALVLAPPGCGKTEILAHRIVNAHEQGIQYSDMLCLTFTNRASRGMRERIASVNGDYPEELFVGNIHRFCSEFLFGNHIVPIDSSIIDELDQEDILNTFGLKKRNSKYDSRHEWHMMISVSDIQKCASTLYQIRHNHPGEVWLYDFVFDNEDPQNKEIQDFAEKYIQFKEENNVLDFNDLLLYTYTALMQVDYRDIYERTNYKWIQIDEVQDLNRLQFSIVDKITSSADFTVMYLGDEQQAIFSFMGARLNNLEMLKEKASGKVLRLYKNHRSPKYLLDLYNDFAIKELGINSEFLPDTDNFSEKKENTVCIKTYERELSQLNHLPIFVNNCLQKYPNERVAILVRTNREANDVSEHLQIPHFKISGTDVFKSIDYKTLTAHFAVVHKDTNMMEWARILYKTKSVLSYTDARTCVEWLRKRALSPSDLLLYSSSSYILEFTKVINNQEFVIFDTETTGLNVFEDDIIQIAAIKVKDGKIVPNSEFDIIIETDKIIPPKLGTKKNPMVEEYEERKKIKAEDALPMFLEYVGNAVLFGHNVNYDINILKHNLSRRCHLRLEDYTTTYFDTLKISRLLEPNLRKYKLEELLKTFQLEGINSHKALDDVKATYSLIKFCFDKAQTYIEEQKKFLNHPRIKEIAENLRSYYGTLYEHTANLLYSDDVNDSFIKEFEYIYEEMSKKEIISKFNKFEYVKLFLSKNMIKDSEKYFIDQISNHITDIKSFTEADLCGNDGTGIITEKVFLMTVHKAKGLEFETVIIYNAIDGRYPWYSNNTIETIKEDKRLFYVAMSRAKKRLYISWSEMNRNGYNNSLTPFINSVREHFDYI